MQLNLKDGQKVGHNGNPAEFKRMRYVIIIMFIHIGLTFWLQTHAQIGGDGIFTYTLANNPYSFEYIDYTYKRLPQNNGWISAHILRESYIIEDYDKFNYSSVYFHQRIDNHPLLYYTLVHTVCSIFANSYSNLYTMIINLFFLCAVDILIIRLFWKLYGKAGYAVVPFAFLFLMVVMQELYVLPRMYMALAFFCFWYLYMHWNFISNEEWKKSDLVKMTVCVFLGTQTHYYFYVYAFSLTVFTIVYLLFKHRKNNLFWYVYSGIIGIAVSWILFPWIIWHIFLNQMSKHTEIESWSLKKFNEYVQFLNDKLFNGRGMIAIGIVAVLCICVVLLKKTAKPKTSNLVRFHVMVFGSGFIYSLIIFTLDDAIWYYMTPLFLTFILWFSMILLGLIERIVPQKRKEALTSGIAVICIIIVLSISAVIDWAQAYLKEYNIVVNLRNTAQEYQQYDCIFIEQYQNNLFQGYWFEFGDYDEFKKIPLTDFQQKGITKEDLMGRKDDSGLIVYAPMECVNGKEYKLLASRGSYGVYELDDEAIQ